MLSEALWREKANWYLEYVFIPVRINTGPSSMKGAQNRCHQLVSLKNSALPRSQHWFLWLAGWTFRDVCVLLNGNPLGQCTASISATMATLSTYPLCHFQDLRIQRLTESFCLLSFQCLSSMNVFWWILICSNKNLHTSEKQVNCTKPYGESQTWPL